MSKRQHLPHLSEERPFARQLTHILDEKGLPGLGNTLQLPTNAVAYSQRMYHLID